MSKDKGFDRIAATINRGTAGIQATRKTTVSSLEENVRGIELVPVARIQGRLPQAGRTRKPSLEAALDLARSILAAGGLLHNLGVDRSYHIIYGEHRYYALRILAIASPLERIQFIHHHITNGPLLATPRSTEEIEKIATLPREDAEAAIEVIRALPPEEAEKHPLTLVVLLPHRDEPIHVMLFEPQNDEERRSIEFIENRMRRSYRREEIEELARSLIERGYKIGNPGRPSKEEAKIPAEKRQVIPALAEMLRLSERQIMKILRDRDKVGLPQPARKPAIRQLLGKLKAFDPCGDAELATWVEGAVAFLAAKASRN